MEDIIYWDNEGCAFLFNFLKYIVEETNPAKLKKALEIKNPDRLKSLIKECNSKWVSPER
jgi:hypothetical protein